MKLSKTLLVFLCGIILSSCNSEASNQEIKITQGDQSLNSDIGGIVLDSIDLNSAEKYSGNERASEEKFESFVEGTFKGRNCDELHAFQSTGGRVIGGMNDKVKAELKRVYEQGINPEVSEVFIMTDTDKMEVKWKVKITPSTDGKAWVGFTSRGSSGSKAYDRADGKHVGQDYETVLGVVRKSINEPSSEMKLVYEHLFHLNINKETLGKCPTRQLFYKYTMPTKFPDIK
jgi:hypothetical protein